MSVERGSTRNRRAESRRTAAASTTPIELGASQRRRLLRMSRYAKRVTCGGVDRRLAHLRDRDVCRNRAHDSRVSLLGLRTGAVAGAPGASSSQASHGGRRRPFQVSRTGAPVQQADASSIAGQSASEACRTSARRHAGTSRCALSARGRRRLVRSSDVGDSSTSQRSSSANRSAITTEPTCQRPSVSPQRRPSDLPIGGHVSPRWWSSVLPAYAAGASRPGRHCGRAQKPH